MRTLISRDESLVSWDVSLVSLVSQDENLVSREGGNLLLSSTMHASTLYFKIKNKQNVHVFYIIYVTTKPTNKEFVFPLYHVISD